jgi:hypothetical protein
MSEWVTPSLRLQSIDTRKRRNENKLILWLDKKKRIKKFKFER